MLTSHSDAPVKRSLVEMEMDHVRASEAVLALNDRLDGGEAVPEAEYEMALAPFKESLGLVKSKRDRFAEFILFLGKQSEMYAERAAMDTKRKRAIDNLVTRLKDMASFAIRCTDSNKLEGDVRSMALCKNSQDTLTIKDEALLPAELYDPVPSLNKDRLKDAIRAGNIPPEVAELVRGEHLRIR